MENTQELTQGIGGPFEVVGYIGVPGKKTWHLRQKQTGQEYRVTPDTTASWQKAKKPPKGPCIILSIKGSTMVGMHLETGTIFDDNAPPTGLKK